MKGNTGLLCSIVLLSAGCSLNGSPLYDFDFGAGALGLMHDPGSDENEFGFDDFRNPEIGFEPLIETFPAARCLNGIACGPTVLLDPPGGGAQSTPEPAGFALMGVALAALGALRLRGGSQLVR
jgi:hypothetical protein